jgi:uncharacterized RDD family membrane protein YckC
MSSAEHQQPLTPASAWRRFAAMGYDLLLLAAVLFAVSGIAVAVAGGAIASGNVAFQLYLLFITYLYFAVFWKRAGYTPGMRPWRMRVERLDGGSLGWRQTVLRFSGAWLSLAACGLGFFWALWDADKRMWHDRLSGTRVVKDWSLYK